MIEDSEKSSLADELLSDEGWPLFIQFSIALHLPGGQMDSHPVGFIPNCILDVFNNTWFSDDTSGCMEV